MSKIKLFKAIKNKKIKEWFYFLKHGHEFLLTEEVDIIWETRSSNQYKHLSEYMIQKLIKIRIRTMYKEKYPNAKSWSISNF